MFKQELKVSGLSGPHTELEREWGSCIVGFYVETVGFEFDFMREMSMGCLEGERLKS